MACSTALRGVLAVVLATTLVLAVAESSVVREIGKLKPFVTDALPGLTHITLLGALQDGMKEVEAWVETVTSGHGTPIHRHDCEEIFIIVKGGGTVYIAPKSDKTFPGEPVATPFSANSTFAIPVNSVHRVVNTNEEDLHFYVIISKPPLLTSHVYKDWNTRHDDAVPFSPLPWDAPEATKDEL